MNWLQEAGGNAEGRRFSFSSIAILACAVAAGAAISSFSGQAQFLLATAAGIVGVGLLILCPELALALYVIIGDIKGDDRASSLVSVDLTLALGAVLLAGICLNLLRGRRAIPMPSAYLLFLALLTLMTVSLGYTPVFEAGVEKLGRFLTVTGIVIVAPFFVLGTPERMKRFLIGFGCGAFAICAWSLWGLGGSERLATPSNNTIGLGHIACALILLIWFAVVPRYAFPARGLTYLLLGVPAVALIGSGSRGSVIACAAVILLSPLVNRRLLVDLVLLAGLGLAALPLARIPQSSFDYLNTLIRSQNFGSLLDFRSDLLDYGWRLLQQHPLIGAGIGGFRYYSPNPELYKWPHDIFLEIACELGIPAVLIVWAIFGAAIDEALRQLRDRRPPYQWLSQLTAALLLVGLINGINTGDINSDRTTWLFVSLVFVVGQIRKDSRQRAAACIAAAHPMAA